MTHSLPVPRRVLTGHDDSGRSVIQEDGPPPGIVTVEERPGYAMANIWRTGAAPSDPDAPDDILEHRGVLPPEKGTVLRIIDFPPEPGDPKKLEEMLTATFRRLYPDADHNAAKGPHQGMHKTSTVDYAIVLSGSITAIMDEGETTLNAGDILIQRGTNHAWANRSDAVCRMCFVLIDGDRNR